MQPSQASEQSPEQSPQQSRPVVCIVGAGPGLGLASARAFAAAGHDVALTAAIERFVAHTGRLDVLHHNVSVYRAGDVGDVTAADLLADLAVGVGSLLSAVRAALPALRASGGSVLLTGSGVAERPDPGALTLGVQKAAVRNLLLGMAADLAGDGVHAATLTVRGVLAAGTAFDPDLVAARLVAVAQQRYAPRPDWTVLHDFAGEQG